MRLKPLGHLSRKFPKKICFKDSRLSRQASFSIPEIFEEFGKDPRAFLCLHAGTDFEAMVQPCVLGKIIQRAASPGLRIETAEDEPVDAGLQKRSHAHQAGLERHIDGYPCKPPAGEFLRHFGQKMDFRVSQGIFFGLAQIMRFGNQLSPEKGAGSNRDFVFLQGFLGLPQGLRHSVKIRLCGIEIHGFLGK